MNEPASFRSYVSPRSRARLTKILLIAGAIVSAVSMVLSALELVFPTLSPEDEVEDNPGGALIALLQLGLGSIQALFYIATAVCFLMWLYRSYGNLHSFGAPARNTTYSGGWAVGSFFIPFVNLVAPYRAVKELWRKSVPPTAAFLGDGSPPAWFPLWWLFWLLSNFASNVYFRMAFREDTPRDVIAVGGVIADALSIIAAIFAIVVVDEITQRQEVASRSLGLVQPPSHPPPPPSFEPRPWSRP